MSNIKDLNEDDFDDFISEGNTIVDFWAEWCGPCKIMGPDFDKASKEVKNVRFAKVDVDGNQDIAGKFGIMSIPTTILFKDGEIVDRHTGALRLADIKKIISDNF